MDPNRHFDEVIAMLVRRDLKNEAVVANRVVIADHPFFLYTQNVPYSASKWHKGRQVALWGFDEPGVAFGDVDVFQKLVGLVDIRDLPGPQLLWQPTLQRPEHSL